MIQDNFASMAQIATANGIQVILASILPVYDYPWRPGIQPSQRIIDINAWMKDYSEQHDHIYLDYFSAVVDDRNGMDMRYSFDGVHANKEGYTIMETLAEEAITQALSH
jgi:lysophospholipase L1-like esterase